MGKEVHIFIDEYATPDLDISKQGVEPYFIYAAVVIENENIQLARQIHKTIIDKHFGKTHIKSNNIQNNDRGFAKTMLIISDLLQFKHLVHILIVDKSKINSDGLTYKQSFIKYFNKILAKSFISKYDVIHIVLDKTGWPEFQISLMEYMKQQLNVKDDYPTLFPTLNNTFELKDDITEEVLLQLADFYAGCIGKYYCGRYAENKMTMINNSIRKYLYIDWFPKEYVNYNVAINFNKNFDKDIFNIAIKTATLYLEKNKDNDIGCEIVYLLLQETKINPLRLISSKEIRNKLKIKGLEIGDPIREISKLRDSGVIIISPIGKKGYKFPNNKKEIAEFYSRLSSNIIPQLKRGFNINRILNEQSFGKYNILSEKEFDLLYQLMNKVQNQI